MFKFTHKFTTFSSITFGILDLLFQFHFLSYKGKRYSKGLNFLLCSPAGSILFWVFICLKMSVFLPCWKVFLLGKKYNLTVFFQYIKNVILVWLPLYFWELICKLIIATPLKAICLVFLDTFKVLSLVLCSEVILFCV